MSRLGVEDANESPGLVGVLMRTDQLCRQSFQVKQKFMRPTMKHSAFTLVELLVVIAIIGTLVGLLLPAVQAARESARRSSCSNRLKQLGLALHNHNDAKKALPIGINNTINGWGGDGAIAPYARGGWFPLVLPYCEENGLYDQWWSRVSANPPLDGFLGFPGRTTVVNGFRCASDPNNGTIGLNGFKGNYALCGGGFGWGNANAVVDTNGNAPTGIFYPVGSRQLTGCKLKEITDGLSKTIMASEIVLVLDTEGNSIGAGYDMRGLYWNNAHMNTLLVTARPPNASAGDVIGWACRNTAFAPCASSSTSGNIMTPRSRHPGGAHCLLADGSVAFVTNSINTNTFQHLGTKADGEVASVP